MKEKVVEILIFIMNEIHHDKTIGDIDLRDLKNKGYTQSEISAAFSWLYDTMHLNETGAARIARSKPGSRRILHEAEKHVFTTEGYGYLIQLQELGLLDNSGLEAVIERAIMSDYEKLSPDELVEIVASVLFTKGDTTSGTNRLMLNSKDTIH